jgi:hypothetical protein
MQILAHNSVIFMIEASVNHCINLINHMIAHHNSLVEVKPAAVDAYDKMVNSSLNLSVWNAGNCSNWYINETGQVTALWPFTCWKFHRLTSDTDSFESVYDFK